MKSLDVATRKVTTVAELARRSAIVQVTQTRRSIVAIDADGRVIRIDANGQYEVFRNLFGPGEVRALSGAHGTEGFAALSGRREVHAFADLSSGDRTVTRLDFDATFLAMSPDGYVVAVCGDANTWIINAINGLVLHRVRSGSDAGMTFAQGHVYVARRRGQATLFDRVG